MAKYKKVTQSLEELVQQYEAENVLLFQKGSVIPVPKTRSSSVVEHGSRQDYTMRPDMRQRKATPAELAAQREKRIIASVEARKIPWTKDNWRERMAAETAAIGDKVSLQQIPVIGKHIPSMLDATGTLGQMASALGSAPLRAKNSNSVVPYVTAVGMPLVAGALGGVGARNTAQFSNNIVNPLAGLSNVTGIIKRYKPVATTIKPKPAAVGNQLRPPPAEIHMDVNSSAKPRVVHGLYDDFDPNGTVARYDPRGAADHADFMDEFVDNSMIKPKSALGKAKEYSKAKLQSVDRKLGAVIDRSEKVPGLSSIVDEANKKLVKGLGINKTGTKVQLKYGDDNTIRVLVNDINTGSMDVASMATQRKSLTELLRIRKAKKELVNKYGHSNSMFENATFPGYAKQGDFPFSLTEGWGKTKLEEAFGPGISSLKTTGISGEINQALSESLKAKKARLYSGGTGHTMAGQERYDKLLLKGIVQNITGRNAYGGSIYMYKRNGGKLIKRK